MAQFREHHSLPTLFHLRRPASLHAGCQGKAEVQQKQEVMCTQLSCLRYSLNHNNALSDFLSPPYESISGYERRQ